MLYDHSCNSTECLTALGYFLKCQAAKFGIKWHYMAKMALNGKNIDYGNQGPNICQPSSQTLLVWPEFLFVCSQPLSALRATSVLSSLFDILLSLNVLLGCWVSWRLSALITVWPSPSPLGVLLAASVASTRRPSIPQGNSPFQAW